MRRKRAIRSLKVDRSQPRSHRLPLAECLRAQMLESKCQRAWAGDPDLMLAAYARSGGAVVHPQNRIKAVVDAARRSSLFVRCNIRAADAAGRREVLHPVFTLKAAVPGAGRENTPASPAAAQSRPTRKPERLRK